ncbi:MAG: regulator of sirC expression with transglutaminase-like and TPR domain [Myxococcota bacterium]|jgi:regulator of sirC expression with transglutaminase-like and TPR domain
MWSDADAEAERTLVATVVGNDLVGALLAIEGADDLLGTEVRGKLAVLAGQLKRLVDDGADTTKAFIEVLVEGAGFQGDTDDYYAPANSHISRVLTSGRGMPIVVSAIWIAVGQLAGVEIDGVALPGHFIVRLDGAYVDPFQGGAELSELECRRIAVNFTQGRSWDEAWLDTVLLRPITERVLRNLINSYRRLDARLDVYRSLRLLAALAHNDAAVQLELADMTEEFGAYRLATSLFQAIAKRFPTQREAQIATIRAVELSARSRTLN